MDSWNGLLPMECIALDQTSCITVGKHTLYNFICLFWWNWRKYFWLHSALSSSGQIALLIAKETANKRTDNLQLLNEQLCAAASESDSGTEVIYWDYRKTDTSCLVAKVSAKCCQMVKKKSLLTQTKPTVVLYALCLPLIDYESIRCHRRRKSVYLLMDNRLAK